jgi:two-component system probable response regulator PhcQ
MTRRILLVDDEEAVLNALRRALRVLLAEDAPAIEILTEPALALQRLEVRSYDIVVSDYRMPGMDGVAFLRQARELQADCSRIVLSASADREVLTRAINEAEILRFLGKPWEDGSLMEAVRAGFAHRDRRLEERLLADRTRLADGVLTRQAIEERRLEELEPGITHVLWGPDGSVMLDGA